MIEKEYIKNGNLVWYEDASCHCVIENVDLATKRSNPNRGEDELAYDIKNILTGEMAYTAVCEHSGITSSSLVPSTKEKVRIWLLRLDADATTKLGFAKKVCAQIEEAKIRFTDL